MTTYYPQRIKTAAATFKYSSTAFADIIFQGDNIRLRLQAPEIGAQFQDEKFKGNVDYGRAPRGVIFYDDQNELFTGESEYLVNYFQELGVDFDGRYITFKVDYFNKGVRQPFATFIVRVELKLIPVTDLLPPNNQRGSGTWSSFQVATSETNSEGISVSWPPFEFFIIILEVDAVTKWAGFLGKGGKSFKTPGILIFFDRRNLSNDPWTVADYSEDRIVFRIQGTNDVIALFLPSDPLPVDSGTDSLTYWVEPETQSNDPSQSKVKLLSQSKAVSLPQAQGQGKSLLKNKEDKGKFFAKALKDAGAA